MKGLACLVAAISVFSLSPAGLLAHAQDSADTPAADAASQETTVPSPSQPELSADQGTAKKAEASDKTDTSRSKDESEGQQTKRLLWVVPNFGAVSANTNLPPLSTAGKFWLATQYNFDYSSFIWTGILAGQQFGFKKYPEFGQGAAGYGRDYWHIFVDGVSETYFTVAILPWATKEDPRYYTLGHGGFFRRAGYALARAVVTKTDAGGTSFNWSQVGGDLLEAGLSNAYYPRQERGLRQTAINWGAQVESVAIGNIATEFWPDIRRHVLRRK